MSHHWDTGFMVHEPSWHRLEKAVLEQSPRSWEDARVQADLTWEVVKREVYLNESDTGGIYLSPATEWQGLMRSDNKALLSIQPKSYEVIHNEQFGEVMQTMLDLEKEEDLVFEALMSLYGGRQVVALLYFEDPLDMPWDNSPTFKYLAFSSRHDGQGGLRGLPTNVRVQCANTLSLAESMDGSYGFTIRHSSNWKDRVEEIRRDLAIARQQGSVWQENMQLLAEWTADEKARDTYMRRLIPISDDMTPRIRENRQASREQLLDLYETAVTTEHIRGTGYGLLMATTEWSDHYRPHRTEDSYVGRQLLQKQPIKAKASKILVEMAAR